VGTRGDMSADAVITHKHSGGKCSAALATRESAGTAGENEDEQRHVAAGSGLPVTVSSDSRHAPVEINALNFVDMRCYVPAAKALIAVTVALVSCASYSEARATTGRPPSSIIIESPADFEIVDSDFTLKLKVLSTV
jgi:hypothetical protein